MFPNCQICAVVVIDVDLKMKKNFNKIVAPKGSFK